MNTLAQYSFGRILLHVICAFRARNWAWARAGIAREFAIRRGV